MHSCAPKDSNSTEIAFAQFVQDVKAKRAREIAGRLPRAIDFGLARGNGSAGGLVGDDAGEALAASPILGRKGRHRNEQSDDDE